MVDKAKAIEDYILSKDGNRPFLLSTAFVEDATLKMNVQTESISFPSSLSGRDAIANTLVREFNQKYENIFTICIGQRPNIVGLNFSCPWLVVMTEKLDESLRVGCGSYDWVFCNSDNRVESLSITINRMETVSSASVAEAINWVSRLAYPWCELSEVTKGVPNNAAVLGTVGTLDSLTI